MLGRELLMALAQREGLRRLDETASAFGVFLDIHQSLPRARFLAPGLTDLELASAGQDVRRNLPPEKGASLDFGQCFQGRGRTVNKVRMAGQPAKIRAIHRYP